MKLNLQKIRSNLEKVQLTLPYSYKQVKEEFENEAWLSHADYQGKAGDPHLCRSTLADPKSSILKEILNFLSTDEIKSQVINQLYLNNNDMKSNWDGWSPEKMFNKTLWGGQFLRDEPGFKIEKHIDSRIQVITMIIYFIEADDPDQSTIFYTDKHGSDPHRIETNFCEGVCFVNDFDVWHEGYNRSTKNRYLITLGLIINA
jgi:hypothetical protein